MKLSLVIATYNRADSLIRTLESVVRQSAAPHLWECVVVNNNSTDSTESRFEAFAARHTAFNLRMVVEPLQGLSNARNCGIRSSRGEYIAIIDDDETIAPEYIASYIDLFDKGKALAAGGAVVPVYENRRPDWISRYTEQLIANPIAFSRRRCHFPENRVPAGGNMAFRREVFDRYGYFNPLLGRNGKSLVGGEENELFARLRAASEPLYYVPSAVIYHHIPDEKLTEERFRRLCFDVGRSKYIRATIAGSVDALYADERRKRIYTKVIAILYMLTLRKSKADWLMLMRRDIGRGIAAQAQATAE